MISLLVVCVLVVLILVFVAAGVAWWEFKGGEPFEKEIVCALHKATEGLDEAQNDDLGAPVINARMSGLVEFVHGLTSVRASERRRNTVPFMLVLAMAVVVAGATIAVVDRVEERRERAACVKALADLQASLTTAGAGDQPDERSDVASRAAGSAAGEQETATEPGPADTPDAPMAPGPTTTATPVLPPTPLPASEVSAFLGACIENV
ncbi:MAG: hypothetical protein M3O70_00875 [Actinomycetota bacterium]|nr:hypothetical protein [Actinomycetota bacterium]